MSIFSWNVFARGELTNNANWFSRIWVPFNAAVQGIWGTNNGWNSITLGNSWVDFNTGTFPAASWRIRDGILHIRGVIKSGTTNTAIFTLPSAAIPATQHSFICPSTAGTARVDLIGGVLKLIGYSTGGSNTFVGLSDISIPID